MTANRLIRIIAGFVIMLSLALGAAASPLFVNINWLWVTLFVGANLFQSGFTQFCLLAIILKKLGVQGSV